MFGHLDGTQRLHLQESTTISESLSGHIQERICLGSAQGKEFTYRLNESMDRQPFVISLIFYISFFVS